ncbi:MAG: methylmalonyl-CoA mutase family protein, partial [Gemmatimonadota bacterium]
AAQEIAFTFANALEYVRRALDRGLALESFGPRLSFFFAAHSNLFEEVAKFRAARRLWARLARERFNALDESARMRFHTQTGGVTLTAQQPLNNVVRVAVQALAAALGGTQSLHTNAYDEALALPTEASANLALRTQQIIAYESGVADTVDPLGGSPYIEALTDELERQALQYIGRVDELGGAANAVEYFKDEIHKASYQHQLDVEAGSRAIVGVNVFREDESALHIERPDYSGLAQAQRARLAALRARRDPGSVTAALERVRAVAMDGSANLLPVLVDAVKAYATLGEISDVLRAQWGSYRGVAAQSS